MGRHRQVFCETCGHLMRSDNLKRHMKRHEKYHETETVNMQSMGNKPLLKTAMVIKPSEMKCEMHYCDHCNYASKHKWFVKRHMKKKHSTPTKTENIQSKENHDNRLKEAEDVELIKESIEVYKICQLLQRMKRKPNHY
jgi:hypothetical protein